MGEEAPVPGPDDGLQLGVGENRAGQLDEVGLLRGVLEQRAPLSELDAQRHHQLLPDRVHRGVGHLGELLVEELGEATGALGEDGQSGVVPHRAQRVVAFGHVCDDQPPLFRGVAEHPTQGRGVEAVVGEIVEGCLDAQGLGVDPVAVGPRRRQLRLYLLGMTHLAGLAVEDDDLPGPELTCGERPCLLLRADTCLRRHEDHLGGDRPSRGPQPVAVHARQQGHPVRCRDGCRAIPGLGEKGVICIEGGEVGLEIAHVLPGRRHQHLLDVGQGPAALHQQLECVVQAPRVGDAGLEERKDVGQSIAPHARSGALLPGQHP